jgi:hypothetical protein
MCFNQNENKIDYCEKKLFFSNFLFPCHLPGLPSVPEPQLWLQALYAEFLLEIDVKILLRKTGARSNLKISLISLHIDPGIHLKC